MIEPLDITPLGGPQQVRILVVSVILSKSAYSLV